MNDLTCSLARQGPGTTPSQTGMVTVAVAFAVSKFILGTTGMLSSAALSVSINGVCTFAFTSIIAAMIRKFMLASTIVADWLYL